MNNKLNSDSSEFDLLIDQATASYTPADPRPGLELRIQNSLASSRDSKRPRFSPTPIRIWSFTIAGIAFASILAIGIWIHTHPDAIPRESARNESRTSSGPTQVISSQPDLAISRPDNARLHELRKSTSNARSRAREANSLELTEQELLLRQLALSGAVKALVPPSSSRDPLTAVNVTELEDKPIKIQPLITEKISIAPIRIAALQPLANPAE